MMGFERTSQKVHAHRAHIEAHIDVRMLKAAWLLGLRVMRTSGAHKTHAQWHPARTAHIYRICACGALFGADLEREK
jgi:hypothetical protein